jgi:hypothetical protein
MSFVLTKEHANKLIKIENSSVVVIPTEEFTMGHALILFNNSDSYISLESKIEKSYQSCRAGKKQFFEWPPRALINILFVDDDELVVSVGY